jgi:F-box and leucine-rich repeat protein GRR1
LVKRKLYRKLRTLRLAECPILNEKAFPATLKDSEIEGWNIGAATDSEEKPATWQDEIYPLYLHHTMDNLRYVDLAFCRITDEAVGGIVAHASKIQTLNLSGCVALTDRAMESISLLGDNLDVLILTRVANITDKGIQQIARRCQYLRCVDLGCEYLIFTRHWY